MILTFDDKSAKKLMKILGVKGIKPKNFAGFVNGRAFTKDPKSLKEMKKETMVWGK